MKNNVVKFRYGQSYHYHRHKLSLGDNLTVTSSFGYKMRCRFVKVTPKGFNLLNLDTNRMVLKRHIYGIGMAGKEYPKKGDIHVKVLVPSYLRLSKKKNLRCG